MEDSVKNFIVERAHFSKELYFSSTTACKRTIRIICEVSVNPLDRAPSVSRCGSVLRECADSPKAHLSATNLNVFFRRGREQNNNLLERLNLRKLWGRKLGW